VGRLKIETNMLPLGILA